MNLLYIFQDPLGSNDSKAGKTSHPDVRLGVYQNSYSARSHLAQFDYAFYGSKKAVDNLEKAIKTEFDWDIEQDGRGFSEWIGHHTSTQVLEKVEEIIEGYRSKVSKVPSKFLPLIAMNKSPFFIVLSSMQTPKAPSIFLRKSDEGSKPLVAVNNSSFFHNAFKLKSLLSLCFL